MTNMVVSNTNSIGYEPNKSSSPRIGESNGPDEIEQFQYQTIQSDLVRQSLDSHRYNRVSDVSKDQSEANIEQSAVTDISPSLDILNSPQIRTKEGLEERKERQKKNTLR